MKTQHTPGPWTKAEPFASVRAPGRPCIADCGSRSDPTAQANARLIAAAPDLLAALESWIACANDGDRHTPAWIDVFNACAAQSRAAIAKARGEE